MRMMSMCVADLMRTEKREDASLRMWHILMHSGGSMIGTSMLWTTGPVADGLVDANTSDAHHEPKCPRSVALEPGNVIEKGVTADGHKRMSAGPRSLGADSWRH